MYARNVKIKLNAKSEPEFTRLFESEIIPFLRTQKEFREEIIFVGAMRNEAKAVSFWNSRDETDAYNHIVYLDVLRVQSNVVNALPIVESYEVGSSTSHKIALSGVG